MNSVLLTAGVVSLIAAVIGGGLKAFNMDLPVLTSRVTRGALGALGIMFLVAAFVLREDTGGDDREQARYERQVVATCKAVRRLANRPDLGSPDSDLTFDRGTILFNARNKTTAIRRRFDLLLEKPVPDGKRDDARRLRQRVENFHSQRRRVLAAFADALPSRPTEEEIEGVAQSVQSRLDRVVTELEDAMTQLAGRDCSLVGG